MAKDPYIQAVRGLAIAAVVLIHCLPQVTASVALRPLLNFSVAVFIFLSGYLTPRGRAADPASFVRRRAGRVAVPYALWTVVYLVARDALAPLTVLAAFIVGGGSAQLYYVVVYLQLVFLTPLLFRLLDRSAWRVALYAVTPATLVARYALSVAGVSLPVQAFCGSWLVFYLLGLEWRGRIGPWLRGRGVRAGLLLGALAVCLASQELEGFAWLIAGSYDLATSQLKLTSMLSSMCACALVAFAGDGARGRLASCRPLVRLGDLSFGIYLSHMAVLKVVGKALGRVALTGVGGALVLWVVVVAATAALVLLCRRLLPRRALHAIGFD